MTAEMQRIGRPSKLLVSLAVAFMLTVGGEAHYACACRENAMIVFDASASMAESPNGVAKIDLARKALADVLPDVTRFRPTGLVTYGGIAGVACSAVAVRADPQKRSGDQIVAKLKMIQPIGATSLTDGVRTAANVLERYGVPGIVVLITDGLENCGGSACRLARRLQDRAHKVRVHVIGFLLHGKKIDTLNCLSGLTDGTYVPTTSLEGLREALRALLGCPQISRLSLPWQKIQRGSS